MNTMRFYADEPIKANDVVMIDPLRPDRVRKARLGMLVLGEWVSALATNDADKDGVVVVDLERPMFFAGSQGAPT